MSQALATTPAGETVYDTLAIGDANFGAVQEGAVLAPSLVGAYPISQSPFGLHDMAGGVLEWVASVDDGQHKMTRGGGFLFEKTSCNAINRAPIEPTLRVVKAGLRVCVTWPHAG